MPGYLQMQKEKKLPRFFDSLFPRWFSDFPKETELNGSPPCDENAGINEPSSAGIESVIDTAQLDSINAPNLVEQEDSQSNSPPMGAAERRKVCGVHIDLMIKYNLVRNCGNGSKITQRERQHLVAAQLVEPCLYYLASTHKVLETSKRLKCIPNCTMSQKSNHWLKTLLKIILCNLPKGLVWFGYTPLNALQKSQKKLRKKFGRRLYVSMLPEDWAMLRVSI
jgi:hypothetical protein